MTQVNVTNAGDIPIHFHSVYPSISENNSINNNNNNNNNNNKIIIAYSLHLLIKIIKNTMDLQPI